MATIRGPRLQRGTSLHRARLAELIGTYVLVFFGVGSVHVAVLTNALHGFWQVAIVWGLAISLAIYATNAVSGAHINPAITLAFAAFRGFPLRKVPAYLLSQLVGAFAAAAYWARASTNTSSAPAWSDRVSVRPGATLR